VIAVVGLGYVGLPLALTFAERGFEVVGLDVDPEKTAAVTRGRSYLKHLESDRLRRVLSSGRLSATSNFDRLREADAILICVPTPLTAQRTPDMSFVVKTSHQIANTMRPGQLIVLESTTYPGTTDGVVCSILEESGHRCGRDFFLAFSPEREDPGNPRYGTHNIPKVVGGVDKTSGELADALYGAAIERTVRVSSTCAAEATKLTENIFRAVNIALVNELKTIFDRMDIDIWEVLDAAATKPFGFMRFNPGPGWGGHCIPLDPFYLSWKAREYGLSARFIELAGEVNVNMPAYVVEKLQKGLNDKGQSVKGARVLILGLAYKKDIDDTRESPSLEIMELLEDLGAGVSFHDPHVGIAPPTRRHPRRAGMCSVDLTEEVVSSVDAVLVVTDHNDVDYDLVKRHARMVVDTRGVFRDAFPGLVRA